MNLLDRKVPIHLLLGQPGSGKDSRLALVAEVTGADIFRFGAIFDRYASALPVPVDLVERASFFALFEERNSLVTDEELLERIDSLGYLSNLNQAQRLWAFQIAYYGGFKTGLIPDHVVNSIFDMELTAHLQTNQPRSIVLNSFPKTLNQYIHLQKLLARRCTAFVQGVAFLMEYTPWDVLENRMANRLICDSCDSVYAASEVQATANASNTCACGNTLKQRRDAQIFEKRKGAYLKHTLPMIHEIQQQWRSWTHLTNAAHFDLVLARSEIQNALDARPESV